MRLFRLTAAAVLAIGLGAFAGEARVGPDPPPAGKYQCAVSYHDGSNPNIPGFVPAGSLCAYPSYEGGRWGVRVHGWVNMPAPPAGFNLCSWRVYVAGVAEVSTDPATPATAYDQTPFGAIWSQAGVCYWTLFVDSAWGNPYQPAWGLPNPGWFRVQIAYEVKTPDTGGWWGVGGCSFDMEWDETTYQSW